ncbi:hypothetical protein, partial [Thiolapillus sp.]
RKVKKSYKAGVSLSKQAMRELEKRFDRKPDLESWFVTINPITKGDYVQSSAGSSGEPVV